VKIYKIPNFEPYNWNWRDKKMLDYLGLEEDETRWRYSYDAIKPRNFKSGLFCLKVSHYRQHYQTSESWLDRSGSIVKSHDNGKYPTFSIIYNNPAATVWRTSISLTAWSFKHFEPLEDEEEIAMLALSCL